MDTSGEKWVPKMMLANPEVTCLGCVECARWILVGCKLAGPEVYVGQWDFPRGTQRRLPDGQWLQ